MHLQTPFSPDVVKAGHLVWSLQAVSLIWSFISTEIYLFKEYEYEIYLVIEILRLV